MRLDALAAGSEPQSQQLLQAMVQQSQAMLELARSSQQSRRAPDALDVLGGAEGEDGGSSFRASGARGAAAMELWSRQVEENPQAVSARIRANRRRNLTGRLRARGPQTP